MQTLPSTLSRFINNVGQIVQPWIGYLQQFTIAPPAFLDIDVGNSPYEYEAKEPGNLFISGGTVSQISLTRGADTIILFPSTVNPRLVPVAVNDVVTVIYTVLPTIKFIPSYGQNTTS